MKPASGYSIRTKLLLGILVPAILLVVVIYLNYFYLSSLGKSAETILAKNYKSIKAAFEISRLIRQRSDLVLTASLGMTPSEALINNQEKRLIELIDICRNNITEVGEKKIVQDLSDLHSHYEKLFSSFLKALSENKPWSRESYLELQKIQTRLNSRLDDLVALNEQAMERADLETQQFAQRAKNYSIAILAATGIFVLVFSLLISRSISRPLVELADTLANVKQEQHDYPRFPVTSKDEIGFLTSQFNHLFERLKEYDQLNLEKLTAERAKVRQAQEAKARFVADLSHQLKTPMTSLSMGIGILAGKAKEALDVRHARLLETAKEDCARLSNLINELADLARTDAMIKPWPKELLDVEEMINKCLDPLFLQAEEKGVNLATDFQSGLPKAYIDSFRFPWVLTNLVGNAIRYTPKGGRISLDVERRANSLLFTCKDTGIGIEPQFLSHIFDRYAQFSEREAMGTIGLGLAIVKEIIEQHGGDIRVISHPGRGTTFTFWIPLREKAEHEQGAGS